MESTDSCGHQMSSLALATTSETSVIRTTLYMHPQHCNRQGNRTKTRITSKIALALIDGVERGPAEAAAGGAGTELREALPRQVQVAAHLAEALPRQRVGALQVQSEIAYERRQLHHWH
jgi:hypothetical protein